MFIKYAHSGIFWIILAVVCFFSPSWSTAWLFAGCYAILDIILDILVCFFNVMRAIVSAIFKIKSDFVNERSLRFFQLFISIIALIFILTHDAKPSIWLIAEFAAPSTVNDIITKNQLSESKCEKVVITDEISDKRFKGVAIMNNDKKSQIEIEIEIGDDGTNILIPAAKLQFLGI